MRGVSVSSCRQLSVSRDLVAKDLKQVHGASLNVCLGFIDSIVKRGNDRADLLVVDSAPVPQPRDDGPDSQFGSVIHGREIMP